MSMLEYTAFDHRRLPPELWIRILEFAAIIPEQLSTDVQNPLDTPFTYGVSLNQSRAELAALQADRASLAGVCSLWNAIVTPHLYQSLYVGSNDALVALTSTLRRFDGHTTPRGHCVHRLDLMMADADGPTPESLDALQALFSRLPSLRILHVCTSARTPSFAPRAALCALRDTCAPSLRTFSWDPASSLRAPMPDTQGLLCTFKRLRTLGRLWWPDCGGVVPGCPYGLPILPSLRCIALPQGHDDHLCPAPRFAALQQIVLAGAPPGGCIDAFVREHADGLKSAVVEVREEAEETNLGSLMGCHSLAHLVLRVPPELVRALSCWCLPPAVSHLGVHVGRPGSEHDAKRGLVVLLGHLSSMEARSLQVVRLLHATKQELSKFMETDGFALAYDTFARKGWVLEDRSGCRLSPPLFDR